MRLGAELRNTERYATHLERRAKYLRGHRYPDARDQELADRGAELDWRLRVVANEDRARRTERVQRGGNKTSVFDRAAGRDGAPKYTPASSSSAARSISSDHELERDDDDEDPTPWCHLCWARRPEQCDCPPRAEND
jgi:hypothetical protein